MVALKFGMFRELAKTKEDQAVSEVKSIKAKQLGECVYRCIVIIEVILKFIICTGT